jgi:hypothetical protein
MLTPVAKILSAARQLIRTCQLNPRGARIVITLAAMALIGQALHLAGQLAGA